MRILFFLIIALLIPLFPWYVLIALALAYALLYDGPELLLLAAAVDAYYGPTEYVPYYTLGMCIILLTVTMLKPRLLMYTEHRSI